MKVLLFKDVEHLGQKGDIKDVSGGYARNFLFVRGLAKHATQEVLKEAELLKKEHAEKQASDHAAFEESVAGLKNLRIIVEAKANEQGGLFRAVSSKQIASSMHKEGIKDIREDDIKIKDPIKSVGEHDVEINRKNISHKFKIVVKAKNIKEESGDKNG